MPKNTFTAISTSTTQLALNLSTRPNATFANFVEPDGGRAVRILQDFLHDPEEMVVFISGEKASGKSHLLMAALAEAGAGKGVYLSCKELVSGSTSVLNGLESMALICLDDIDCATGSEVWQLALFHLFNRCQHKHCKWIVAGNQTPSNLSISLADLRTRLGWGITLRLPALVEEQRLLVLENQARHFGLSLSTDVKYYIIKRAPRDLGSLTELLYQLEQAAMQEKRSLSIPFIKAQLGW